MPEPLPATDPTLERLADQIKKNPTALSIDRNSKIAMDEAKPFVAFLPSTIRTSSPTGSHPNIQVMIQTLEFWMLLVPRSRLLVREGHLADGCFVERLARNLKAGWQTIAVKTAWYLDCR